MSKTQTTPAVQVQVSEPEQTNQPPAFSQLFVTAMIDYAYNTLDDYLEAQKVAPEARELLAALLQLTTVREMYKEQPLVSYIWNDEACYSIATVSHAVPKLGGHFIVPSGIVLK